jgi:hypothetical protein
MCKLADHILLAFFCPKRLGLQSDLAGLRKSSADASNPAGAGSLRRQPPSRGCGCPGEGNQRQAIRFAGPTPKQHIRGQGHDKGDDQSLAKIYPAKDDKFVDHIDDDRREKEPGDVVPALRAVRGGGRDWWRSPSLTEGAPPWHLSRPRGLQAGPPPLVEGRAGMLRPMLTADEHIPHVC